MSRQVCEIEGELNAVKGRLHELEQELKQANEKHYYVGQWFKKNDFYPTIGVLAQVDSWMVEMICFEKNGNVNRWHSPVKVKDIKNISKQEFDEIAGFANWTVINAPVGVTSC